MIMRRGNTSRVPGRAWALRGLLAGLALAASLAQAGDRLVLDLMAAEDSDGLRQHSLYAGAVKAWPALGKDASTGLRAGYWQLEGPLDRIDFTGLRVDHRQALGSGQLGLGLHQLVGDDWSPTLGYGNAVVRPLATLALDVGVDRELVDTVIAARRETTLDAWHVVADWTITPQWVLVAGPQRQDFSDGNRRQGGLLRLVWSPAALEGFNAQLRLRRLDGDFRGIGYFSPDRFEEGLLQLQYGRAVAGGRLVLTGVAGAGAQRVDATATDDVFLAELRARGWLSEGFGLEGKAGCTNTGELVASAAGGGYRYCQLNLTLMRPW